MVIGQLDVAPLSPPRLLPHNSRPYPVQQS